MIEPVQPIQSSQPELLRSYQRKYLEELMQSIRAADPEAVITHVHDEIVVKCREENLKRVLHMITGGLIVSDESHYVRKKT